MKRALLWLLLPLFLNGAAPLNKKLYEQFFSSQSSDHETHGATDEDEEELLQFGPDMHKSEESGTNHGKSGNNDIGPEKNSPVLRAWTGTGSPGQQTVFSFSEMVSIDSGRKDLSWWFRITKLHDAPFALWQISESPFTQSVERWNDPDQVLASGPVVNESGLGAAMLFQLDLSRYVTAVHPDSLNRIQTCYVRVIRLDSKAQPLWPPSNTVTIYYGAFSPPPAR